MIICLSQQSYSLVSVLNICISVPSGCYGLDINLEKLKDFHRRRLQVLVNAGADLLAFETIPNKLEAQACSFIVKILCIFSKLKLKLHTLLLYMKMLSISCM